MNDEMSIYGPLRFTFNNPSVHVFLSRVAFCFSVGSAYSSFHLQAANSSCIILRIVFVDLDIYI